MLDNLGPEYGISSNDATHRLTSAFIVDLPFGRGRWIGGNMNRMADAIAGGWSLYSFLTIQSGQPLAIFDSASLLTDGNQRPNITCPQLTRASATVRRPRHSNHTSTRTASRIREITFREMLRGTSPLRGDGVRNVDLSLSKMFKIKEDKQLQIRAEAFNIFNRQRFAFPDVGSGDGSFGSVFSTTGNFRKMQFGARFQF